MNLGKRIVAEIRTAIECKEYNKNKENTRIAMILMDKKYKEPTQENYTPHPYYAKHLEKCKSNFIKYVASDMKYDTDKTIGIGDSILAQSIDDVDTVINTKLNWALGGMRACHMVQLMNDMEPLMKQYNFIPNNIVIGTPDGNGLLVHNEINCVKEQCKIALNRARSLSPTSRIIIYGIPLTIVDYVIKNFIEYDMALIDWMLKDKNAVMIPLIKNFVQAWHIFMKADYSSDGVHLSPIGRCLFSDLIKKAKTAQKYSLIN
jgi:hypothetical protein